MTTVSESLLLSKQSEPQAHVEDQDMTRDLERIGFLLPPQPQLLASFSVLDLGWMLRQTSSSLFDLIHHLHHLNHLGIMIKHELQERVDLPVGPGSLVDLRLLPAVLDRNLLRDIGGHLAVPGKQRGHLVVPEEQRGLEVAILHLSDVA